MLPTGSPYQDPAGNWTTRRSHDDRKKTQTAVIWSCFPVIRSGQNHLARHSERGKKTRRTKEEVGRQHQGIDRPGVRQVPEGSGEQEKMEKTGCKIICGAPTTLAVNGLMMMMMSLLQVRAKDWNDIFDNTFSDTLQNSQGICIKTNFVVILDVLRAYLLMQVSVGLQQQVVEDRTVSCGDGFSF